MPAVARGERSPRRSTATAARHRRRFEPARADPGPSQRCDRAGMVPTQRHSSCVTWPRRSSYDARTLASDRAVQGRNDGSLGPPDSHPRRFGRIGGSSPPAAYHKHRAAGPSPEELIPRRTPRDSTVTTTKRRRPKIRHPHATHEAIQARGPKA